MAGAIFHSWVLAGRISLGIDCSQGFRRQPSAIHALSTCFTFLRVYFARNQKLFQTKEQNQAVFQCGCFFGNGHVTASRQGWSRMGTAITDIRRMRVQALASSVAGAGRVVACFVMLGLALIPYAASAGQESHFAPIHEIAAAPQSDTSHAEIICDDGIVCASFSLIALTADPAFELPSGFRAVSNAHPFVRFMSPQVDLPPPRGIVQFF